MSKNSRIAMEYANTIGDLELLGLLIEKEKTSSLAINRNGPMCTNWYGNEVKGS